MQHQAADHLHIKVAHPGRTHAGFAHHRESFRQDLVEYLLLAILAIVFIARVFNGVGNPRLVFRRFLAQLFVSKLLDGWLKLVDPGNQGVDSLQESFVTAAENFG